MGKLFGTVLCVVTGVFCQGQAIVTCPANARWVDSLKTQPLTVQVQMLKDRIVSDTNVSIAAQFPDGLPAADVTVIRQQGCCKPVLILNGYVLSFSEAQPGNDVTVFLDILSRVTLHKITVLTTTDMQAVHHSQMVCGVIQMEVRDKAGKKLIKDTYGRLN